MPALQAIVSTFLTKVKNDLSVGSDLATPGSGNIRGAAMNFLRAQDMASVLELLEDALTSGTLTATGGSTTTYIDGANTFAAGSQVGSVVTFAAATTTVALRGVTAVVKSHTDTTLTFTTTLPGAVVSGDTMVIRPALVTGAVSHLREGKAKGDAPAGSVYGEARVVIGALNKLLEVFGKTQATGVLTLSANVADGDTVTIGGKVYTFQDTLTDVNGNVDIGGSASASIDNLIAAINLGAGAGTTYATSMTRSAAVNAAVGAGDTMGVTAYAAVGAAGNAVATTEVSATASWGAATLTGGAGGALVGTTLSRPGLQVAAGSTVTQVQLETAGIPFRIDQFKGAMILVAGETSREILRSDETSVTVRLAYGSAPTATTAVTLSAPLVTAHSRAGNSTPHPGGQPGENVVLANLIGQAQAAVVAFTLPV